MPTDEHKQIAKHIIRIIEDELPKGGPERVIETICREYEIGYPVN